MSVTIRLARIGKRNQPAYRIVVANTKGKRNGKALDYLGHYNPSEKPVAYELDQNKYDNWVKKGALVTDAVKKLIEGTYEYVPYRKGGSDNETLEEETEQPAEKVIVNSDQPKVEAASEEKSLENEGENEK